MAGRHAVRNTIGASHRESMSRSGRALFCGCLGTTAAMCRPCGVHLPSDSKRIVRCYRYPLTLFRWWTVSTEWVASLYAFCNEFQVKMYGPKWWIIFRTTRFEAGPPDSQGWWSGGPLPQNVNFEPWVYDTESSDHSKNNPGPMILIVLTTPVQAFRSVWCWSGEREVVHQRLALEGLASSSWNSLSGGKLEKCRLPNGMATGETWTGQSKPRSG